MSEIKTVKNWLTNKQFTVVFRSEADKNILIAKRISDGNEFTLSIPIKSVSHSVERIQVVEFCEDLVHVKLNIWTNISEPSLMKDFQVQIDDILLSDKGEFLAIQGRKVSGAKAHKIFN